VVLRYVFVHNLDVKDMSVMGKVPCILDHSISWRRVNNSICQLGYP